MAHEMASFFDRSVQTLDEVRAIGEQISARCHAAVHPRSRHQLTRLSPVDPQPLVGRPLYKVLSKLLPPFSTQELGGFEVHQSYTRAEAYAHLRDAITRFDGLTVGIEASIASCVTDIPHFRKDNHQQEAVVYSPTGRLHPTVEHSGPRGLRWSRFVPEDGPEDGPELYLFHAESGTMDPRKSGPNRALFFDVLRGAVPALGYDPSRQLSFWDVNVDMTASPAVPPIDDTPGGTLAQMLAHTQAHPIQLILPAVRVFKQRVACRPFANNQVHKGGIGQRAESMVAVAPRDWSVEALDADGLYVLRDGQILYLDAGARPREVASVDHMQWKEHRAFSPEVFLDHKPIAVRLNGRGHQFWNFMDIRSSKGIGEDWYDRMALADSDAEFWQWLTERFG